MLKAGNKSRVKFFISLQLTEPVTVYGFSFVCKVHHDKTKIKI